MAKSNLVINTPLPLAQIKTVSFVVKNFPENWEGQKLIQCLAMANRFPHLYQIPGEPNPRQASTKQSVYKLIVQTLLDEPEQFHEMNLGVKLYGYIDAVEIFDEEDTKLIKVKFYPPTKEGEIHQGHSDGQHTMLALHDPILHGHNLSKCFVNLTIEQRQPTEEDKRKACDRQVIYKHDRKTRYNASGKFKIIKEFIPSNWKIAYYQNQPEISLDPRCSIDYILQKMGMLSPRFNWLNPSNNNRFPVVYVSNLSGYYDSMLANAEEIKNLIDDVAMIEYIFWTIAKEDRDNLAFGVPTFQMGADFEIIHPCADYIVSGIHAPRSSILPTLSAFRVLLEYNPYKNEWNWALPFKEKDYKPLVKKLWEAHKSELQNWVELNSKSPLANLLRNRDHWHKLHSIAFAYLNNMAKKSPTVFVH